MRWRCAVAVVRWIGVIGAAALAMPAFAASLSVAIHYPGRQPGMLDSAFVYLVPDEPVARTRPHRTAELAQEGRLFRPYTQAVEIGDTVLFPNLDTVSHHVYSFSRAKEFELPLYSAEKNPPRVVFDRPGVVVLGCNIHDWMLAFVLVLETPWYQRVKDDRVLIEGLPDGHYTLYFWYPSTDAASQVMRTVEVHGEMKLSIDLLDRPVVLEQPLAPSRRPGRREDY